VATLAYAVWGGDDFLDRSTLPTLMDNVDGRALVVLVLEAARRTTGWSCRRCAWRSSAYAWSGPGCPRPGRTAATTSGRLVGTMYMTLEGIFGTGGRCVLQPDHPLHDLRCDPAVLRARQVLLSTFPSPALGGKPTGAGRTIVLSSFLLGGRRAPGSRRP
jgi:hypothetical protein